MTVIQFPVFVKGQTLTDDDLNDLRDSLEEIDRLPAHGLRGALAKLRVALCEHVGGDPLELHPASRRGEEIDPDTLPDRSARLLLEAIQTLERLAKADAS